MEYKVINNITVDSQWFCLYLLDDSWVLLIPSVKIKTNKVIILRIFILKYLERDFRNICRLGIIKF